MAITAAQVKELRDSTGAGMMDAKKALTENDGDMDAAVDWLRTKGLAKAAKKSGRTAAEGLVAVKTDGGTGVAVEVNSETDFVAKNAEFQQMVGTIAGLAMNVDSVEALSGTDVGNGKPVSEMITDKIATIGENLSLRRMQKIGGGKVVSYVHNAATGGMGGIGVLVAFDGDDTGVARQIAMHVAAANPAALDEAALDADFVARERQVLTEQARESGKPEAVIEKMIDGRMKKFYAENTLLGQAFVVNPDLTVEAAAKDAGITVTGFVRMVVGEGIEKEADDFAAEVAALNKG
ncbi:MAG: elongation factor Ts [Rhodobacteraceae bacterium]|nr:elongation factor Ts [Paracoccaceae bacterium]